MESPKNLLVINARPVPDLAAAIDHWLVVRVEYKERASDENQHA
jgi:hypothetical protein